MSLYVAFHRPAANGDLVELCHAACLAADGGTPAAADVLMTADDADNFCCDVCHGSDPDMSLINGSAHSIAAALEAVRHGGNVWGIDGFYPGIPDVRTPARRQSGPAYYYHSIRSAAVAEIIDTAIACGLPWVESAEVRTPSVNAALLPQPSDLVQRGEGHEPAPPTVGDRVALGCQLAIRTADGDRVIIASRAIFTALDEIAAERGDDLLGLIEGHDIEDADLAIQYAAFGERAYN